MRSVSRICRCRCPRLGRRRSSRRPSSKCEWLQRSSRRPPSSSHHRRCRCRFSPQGGGSFPAWFVDAVRSL